VGTDPRREVVVFFLKDPRLNVVVIHKSSESSSADHTIFVTTFPCTDVGVVLLVLRSLSPETIGHFVFVQRGSVEGAKGIKFRVIEVVTVPSTTVSPGLTKRTVISTALPGTGGSGFKARSVN